MRFRRGRSRSASAGALACVFVVCGCVSDEGASSRTSGEREKGSYIARTLAERAPPKSEPAPAPPKTKPFVSPFGQAIVMSPVRHAEKSLGGRDLNYWVLGDGPETVLLLGGIHGDERSSSEAAYDFLQYVLRRPELLARRRLVVAPEVNPDGIAAATRRNERGVDLNRNFPAQNWRGDERVLHHGPGEEPGSEPETRFVLALLHRYPPSRVVATHAAAACVNWDGPGEALAREMSRECGLPAKATIGYPTPGSLGSLMGIDREVPTITFELPRKEGLGDGTDDVRRALTSALAWSEPGVARR
jgi:protein MpaA